MILQLGGCATALNHGAPPELVRDEKTCRLGSGAASHGGSIQSVKAARLRDLVPRAPSYTPKHASWLNMLEIEIGVLRTQCLNRRIEHRAHLVSEIAAWERQRNASRARVKWMFTTERARAKLARA